MVGPAPAWLVRCARAEDLPRLKALMDVSIRALLKPYLDDASVAASFEIMGLDTQLIDDGTYFAVDDGSRIVGCGGWSRRATLFGGDHSAGRDARLLDPTTEPARVRAMYTDPAYARRGIGRAVLVACEAAAQAQHFSRVELVATLAGEPLYAACGYTVIARMTSVTSSGIEIPLLRMGKALDA